MVFEFNNYRQFLRQELIRRIQENPRYSLRAFARALKLSHSTLSLLLSGKKSLSESRAYTVAQCLSLNPEETEYFTVLVRHDSTTHPLQKEQIQKEMSLRLKGKVLKTHDLHLDQFKLVSDWYYFAILQLFNLKSVQVTKAVVTSRFGLHPIEAQEALERLVRLGLIQSKGKTAYRRIESSVAVKANGKTQSLTQFYQKHLKRAVDAVELQTPEQRVAGWATLALSKKGVEQARALSYQYLKQLDELARADSNKTSIYHFLVHGFLLDSGEK